MSGLRRKYTSSGATTNMLSAFGFTVAMATIMLVLGKATALDIMVAAPPFMFMTYIVLAMIDAQKARRDEDQKDIISVVDLTAQCEKALAAIGDVVEMAAVDFRTYLALNHLAITIRLFVSRYERYLERRGVWAALEAESLLMKAEISGERRLKSHIEPIRDYILEIRANVIDVDDPRLGKIRSAP